MITAIRTIIHPFLWLLLGAGAALTVHTPLRTTSIVLDTNGDSALLSTFKGSGVAIGENIWM